MITYNSYKEDIFFKDICLIIEVEISLLCIVWCCTSNNTNISLSGKTKATCVYIHRDLVLMQITKPFCEVQISTFLKLK